MVLQLFVFDRGLQLLASIVLFFRNLFFIDHIDLTGAQIVHDQALNEVSLLLRHPEEVALLITDPNLINNLRQLLRALSIQLLGSIPLQDE